MTAQKGKDLLIKIADGSGYTTVAGLRTRRLSFNAETVDITHAESANRWRELLDGAGVKRASVSGRGLFRDASSDMLVRQTFFEGAIVNYQIVIPSFGTVQGLWRQFRCGPQWKGFAANTQTFRCFKYHHRCGSRRCVCDRCRALGQADLRRAPALPAITADLAGFWRRLGASGRGRQISCAQAGSRWSDTIVGQCVDGRSLKMKSNFGEVQSMWNKIKSWFKNSTTILWARIQVFIGLVVASLMALASDPNVSSAIQSALQPKFIPYYVIMIGLITEIARRRTVGKEQ